MEQLFDIVKKLPGVQRLVKGIPGDLPCALLCPAKEPRQHILSALFEEGRSVFYVFATEYEARRASEAYIYPEKIFLPAPATELRPVETAGTETRSERVRALDAIYHTKAPVFLSVDALLFKMRPAEDFFGKYVTLKKGQLIKPEELRDSLAQAGYQPSPLVEAPGQFSGRGEIMEVFCGAAGNPFRITFFDREIETIREFDPDSQRSFGKELLEISVPPAAEFILGGEEKEALAAYLEQNSKKNIDYIKDGYLYDLSAESTFANIEAFAGVIPGPVSVLSYGENPLLLFSDGANILADYERRLESDRNMLKEILAEGGAFGCETDKCFHAEDFLLSSKDMTLDFAGFGRHKLYPFKSEIDLNIRNTVGFLGNMDLLADSLKARTAGGYKAYLCAGGKTKAVSEALFERDVVAPVGAELSGPGTAVLPLYLEEGFELSEEKILFLSEKDIFGVAAARRRGKSRNRKPVVLLADLRAGDMVVHEIHGKGRYLGLKTMEVGGVSSEYMEIEYKDNDRLFIPTTQIARLDKYVGPEEEQKLSKLGGREWENAKTRARASVKKLAENLAEIYRERSVRTGYQFAQDTVWQRQFEDNFEYEETPGQQESIEQIKKDMESAKIMDRLLLGDVGYGKTEVALRAAFKAVMDSKQVAVLVPTTLLARQHFNTFLDRFSGFPVRIEQLSRYTKRPQTVMENLRSGKTDIVIGTHKLLNKGVRYKDLGLLVIDEEHRFGVSHKERIKDMKRTVDVLTLTATPIPRTLEMAMTGIRDISTIDTPPDIRKEVQAFVVPFDWGTVRDAVLKEMNRGGQVYFVCRRISEMDYLADRLHKQVPEARLAMAHGRMNEQESESVMEAFIQKQYDLLLCTTIIESGIDIPSVNTIIVYEADKFGLAQLYQLKGRIGRSNLRGYAYFTHLAGENLGEGAQKRLDAIREFTQFGSGMKIAMRDLEIRGAGNILGPEQSGHMADIGYNLYLRMVQEEVGKTMGTPVPRKEEASVELAENAYIPESYISDESLKLDMYKKVAEADTVKKAKEVRAEFLDRFGEPPREVENLLGAAVIKGYASRAGLLSVVRIKHTVNLKFAEDVIVNPEAMIRLLSSVKNTAVLRHTTPPYIAYRLKSGGSYTEMLQFMDKIRHCISFADQV